MKLLLSILLSTCSSWLIGQKTSTLIDPRDMHEYQIVEVNGTWWYAENSQSFLPGSFCYSDRPHKRCVDGNFFPVTIADSACAPGWEIPTIADWHAMLEGVFKSSGKLDSMKCDTIGHTLMYHNIDIMGDNTPLNFQGIHWVQGWRARKGSLTFWLVDEKDDDHSAHVHMFTSGFNVHSHDHHIFDKPRRRRSFNVRCIKAD